MTPPADWIRPKALIGMVHVGALPGTPRHSIAVPEIAARAAAEARILAERGFDALIVENMHDRPYVHGRQGPEIVAAMARIVHEVAAAVPIPLGVQILSGGEREALAVALAAGAAFIRCENFVYSHVADEGLLAEAAAGPLLRYRRSIGAEHVRVMCDIKKKHASHALTGDLTIEDCAHAAEFCGADGVIVTGGFTGRPADPEEVRRVRGAVSLPVWIGSGADPSQLGTLLSHADAVIVGSWIKEGGRWSNPVDARRCDTIVAEAARVRG
jgi:membrane complex biogenesis BtpA family protein